MNVLQWKISARLFDSVARSSCLRPDRYLPRPSSSSLHYLRPVLGHLFNSIRTSGFATFFLEEPLHTVFRSQSSPIRNFASASSRSSWCSEIIDFKLNAPRTIPILMLFMLQWQRMLGKRAAPSNSSLFKNFRGAQRALSGKRNCLNLKHSLKSCRILVSNSALRGGFLFGPRTARHGCTISALVDRNAENSLEFQVKTSD